MALSLRPWPTRNHKTCPRRFGEDDQVPVASAIVVQRVLTRWSKESRGGEQAAIRNGQPTAFALPAATTWHSVEMDERDAFAQIVECAEAVPIAVVDELSLRIRGDQLSVLPQVSAFWMPKRHRRPPRQSIGVGETLRWTLNFRLGLDHGWSYGLITWNLAFLTRGIDSDLFLVEPTISIDERAALR